MSMEAFKRSWCFLDIVDLNHTISPVLWVFIAKKLVDYIIQAQQQASVVYITNLFGQKLLINVL